MSNLSRPGKKNGMYGIRRLGKDNPMFGKKHSNATKAKISKSKTGIITDEKHPSWKGDDASYDAIHRWVIRKKGKANICELCGITKNESIIHWANINHKYSRNLDDYISLCVKCHWKFDKKYNDKKHGVNRKNIRLLNMS